MLRAIPADFWRLWYVGLIASTVRWVETVVVGVVVYEKTGSALVVASITMLRLLPMGLFGAFLGAFAERFDRRLTLAGMVGLLAVTSGRAVGQSPGRPPWRSGTSPSRASSTAAAGPPTIRCGG